MQISNPADLSAAEAAAAIKRGALRSEEIVSACLERITALEPRVRAFVDLRPEDALAQARLSDRRPANQRGALHGVPVAVKEVFDVKGMRCSWGTPIHKGRVPGNDATVVERLRSAGAIILGTTVSTEYAIASPGPTTNPHDVLRSPGGSSSGSAAAVAAGMAPLALGSQTIGSIVRPATYCGIYGLKPTHGAIGTQGAMPLSFFLDHIGFLARTPDDIALACRVLFDRSHADIRYMSAHSSDPDEPAIPRRVLLVDGPLRQRIEPPSRTALERAQRALELAGARVLPTELPADFDDAEACLDTILCRDIAANHGGDRDRAGDQMSPRVRHLVDRGRGISGEQYARAVSRARQYRESLLGLLDENSIILSAATDGTAPLLVAGTGSPSLQGLYTLTGLPALAVPCGAVSGLPVGIQLIAAPGREELLLAAACAMRLRML